MASSLVLRSSFSLFLPTQNCFKNQTHSQFPSSKSFLKPKEPSCYRLTNRKPRRNPVVYALQSNFFKVIQTAWKVGKIEAGTNLVPDSFVDFFLPAALGLALFMLLIVMLIDLYKDLCKGKGPRGGRGSTTTSAPSTDDQALDEAKRIMEKYK